MDTALKAALQPLLAQAPAPPLPLDVINARARRRRMRRRGVASVVAAVVLLGASGWGVAALDGPEPDLVLSYGDGSAEEPAPAPPDQPEAPDEPVEANPVHTSTIEDTDLGSEPGTVEYTGDSWTQCGGCDIPTDDSSYYYGYRAGQSYTVRFSGVQLQVYAPDDLHGGVAEVTVDGEPAATATVDFLTPEGPANRMMWDSGLLPDGDHTVVFTIGPVEPGRDATVVLFDRADVYTAGDATPPEEPPTPDPTPDPPPPTPPADGAAPGLLGVATFDPYEFESWLGRPVDVWETWQPHSWGEMEGVPTLHQYMTGEAAAPFNVRWTGKASIGQPMWAAGESAGTCTSGANDQHMAGVGNAIVGAGFGDAYIRLGWEMDGYWFGDINGAWQDPAGWRECWRRWHGILKGISPDFKLVWNPNWASNTGAGPFDVRTVWPGDEYVDAAGPDIYDWNTDPNATASNGAPVGINAWVDFVVGEHGTPFAMPEWGLNAPNGGGDDPAFINQILDVLAQLKANGNLEYASYFNLDGCVFQIHGGGCNPSSGEAYRARAQAF